MDRVILALACLACAGHGRRVQTPVEQLRSLLFQDSQTVHPVAAFNPSSPRAHLHLENPQRVGAILRTLSGRMDGAAPAPATEIKIRKKGEKDSQLPAAASTAASTKITIRKKDKSDSATDVETKVSVRVRSASDKAAKSDTPAANDDSAVTTVVKVNKPSGDTSASAPAAEAPVDPMAGLSDAEQRLLEGAQRGNCTLILEALQEDANPNILDPNGRTPLHFVAGLGVAPAVVLLIHFGAQVDVPDQGGLTPLHMAAGYANVQTLKVLVGAGADTTIESPTGGTPLNIIISRGNFQLNQFLNRSSVEKLTKKKDEKLEELKACLDVFDDVDKIQADMNWDEMLKEVLTFCALQREKA